MKLVTDDQLREMGIVDVARLPKPIPIPADKANIENIKKPENQKENTVEVKTPDSSTATTGAFSPVGRSAFSHPNGAVSRGPSDDIDPSMEKLNLSL